MAQSKSGHIVNINYAQFWRVDSSCYAVGTLTTPDSPSNDTVYGAWLTRNPVSYDLPIPSRNVVQLPAAGKTVGSHQLGISEIPSFTLSVQDTNGDLMALIGDSTVDQSTNADWSMWAPNNNLATLPRVGLMLSVVYQSTSTTCVGALKTLNLLFPSCQISTSFPGLTPGTAAPLELQVTPTMTGKFPNGDDTDAMGLEDDQDFVFGIVSDYPVAVCTYVANGVATTFNTVYKPISTVVTVNDTPNHFAINGTPTALTSITTGGLATMTAAGSDGDINVLMHETEFVAV